MARGWRRPVEIVLARSGVAAALERRGVPATVILAYHNIVPRGERIAGDLSLHLDQETFADQLDFLLESRTIVGLDEAFDEASASDRRPRVVITFDDAYGGTMSAGAEELRKRDLPATVFVPPALLGSPGFWWDRLAGDDGLDAALREHALTTLQGKGDRILEWAEGEGLPLRNLPEHARPVHSDRLTVTELGKITLGAHTWTHPNLAALPPAEAHEEMRRSRDWVEELPSHRKVEWLAYPYGYSSPTVETSAGELFDGALRVTGGRAIRQGHATAPSHSVPRLSMPRGLSLEGLALRLCGLLA